jgi:hypothetical protein
MKSKGVSNILKYLLQLLLFVTATSFYSKYSRLNSNGSLLRSQILQRNMIVDRNLITNFLNFEYFNIKNFKTMMLLPLVSKIGFHLEKSSIGSVFGAPLMSMIISILLSHIGFLSKSSELYEIFRLHVFPLAIPMLLLDVNIVKCIQISGNLLKVYLLGSFSSIIGSIITFFILSSFKKPFSIENLSAALCSRHVSFSPFTHL